MKMLVSPIVQITESVSHLLSGLNVSTATDATIFSLGNSMKEPETWTIF